MLTAEPVSAAAVEKLKDFPPASAFLKFLPSLVRIFIKTNPGSSKGEPHSYMDAACLENTPAGAGWRVLRGRRQEKGGVGEKLDENVTIEVDCERQRRKAASDTRIRKYSE